MELRERVVQLIGEVIDELNASANADPPIPAREDTVLIGEGGALDSLGFVTLAVSVEEKVEAAFNTAISVFDLVSVEGKETWTVAEVSEAVAKEVGAGA